jgi:putative CocE/NonD family hydrolase
VRDHYSKHEHRIPMRDGARLFTVVYLPRDVAGPRPIMLTRTPYGVGPYGEGNYRDNLGPSEAFTKEKFIFVYQDVRGRAMSEGTWIQTRPRQSAMASSHDVDESSDTYDTVDWLVKNLPGNNGRVGLWGISYAGFYAAAALPGAHPAVRAVSPQAPNVELFKGDDGYHNGAFLLSQNYSFYSFFRERRGPPAPPTPPVPLDLGTPDGYDFFLRMGPLENAAARLGDNRYWKETLAHSTYDAFWKTRAIGPHLERVTAAVLSVGGWFDAWVLAGPLAVHKAIEERSPGTTNLLVMGPWSHGEWARGEGDRLGNLTFGSATCAYYREKIELPFFRKYLEDQTDLHGAGAGAGDLARVTVFHTGSNQWRKYQAWPPPSGTPRQLFFGPEGTLAWQVPRASASDHDDYVSDPARPVPMLSFIARGMAGDYMIEDQRFAAQRPDVLVYQTPPLDEDLDVAGPVGVALYAATTGTDADFVVKLIDVYPADFPQPPTTPDARANAVKMGGFQQLVRGEPFRAKFRESLEKPRPMPRGRPVRMAFDMPDVAHTFRRGHRIMVQVQSSWFPLFDRNPQTFVDIPRARSADFHKATQSVFRSEARPSHIRLWVLPSPG